MLVCVCVCVGVCGCDMVLKISPPPPRHTLFSGHTPFPRVEKPTSHLSTAQRLSEKQHHRPAEGGRAGGEVKRERRGVERRGEERGVTKEVGAERVLKDRVRVNGVCLGGLGVGEG